MDSLQIRHIYALALGKFPEYGVMTFQPYKRSQRTKTMFFNAVCACLDDNLKSTAPIGMKFVGRFVI